MSDGETSPALDTRDGHPDQFGEEAGETLGRVQDAFIDLVAAVPGAPDRPAEIQRALGLQKTLAWKLAKIVEESDRLTVYQRLPGRGAVEKILTSARRVGVDAARITSVRTSLEELDAFVKSHAGRRETIEKMLAGVSRDVHTEIGFRKDSFRGTSHIWGVQARTILRSVIAWPSDDATMLDAAVIFGTVELLRLRGDRPWVINRWRPTDDEGVPIPVNAEAIDPKNNGSAPLLHEFCSEPRPVVRREVREDMTIEDEVAPGRIGTPGAVTCMSAEVLRKVMPKHKAQGSEMYAQNLELRTPCRVVIFDHLVHRGLFGRVSPRLRVFGELAGRPLYSTVRSNIDSLDVFESVDYLGHGPGVLRTPDVPRYDRVVRHVCEKLGWSADDLDVYRLRMEFPYVPSTLTYDYPLPEGTP